LETRFYIRQVSFLVVKTVKCKRGIRTKCILGQVSIKRWVINLNRLSKPFVLILTKKVEKFLFIYREIIVKDPIFSNLEIIGKYSKSEFRCMSQ